MKKPKIIKAVPYQKCPVCNGDGAVFSVFSTDGYWEQTTTLSYSPRQTCPTCQGARIIPMHVI